MLLSLAFDPGLSSLQSPFRISFQFIAELLAADGALAFEGADMHEYAFAAFGGRYEAVAFGVLPLGESAVLAHRVFMELELERLL